MGCSNDNPTTAQPDYERGYKTSTEHGLHQEQSHRCAAGVCQLDRGEDRGQNRVSGSRADPDRPYDDTTSARANILYTFNYNCMSVCHKSGDVMPTTPLTHFSAFLLQRRQLHPLPLPTFAALLLRCHA